MSADDDSAQVEIGVAYRNLPARAPRPVDIGRDTLERQIQSGVFAGKPVLDNHQQEARIGQVLDAWIAPTRSAGDVLMVEYEIDRRSERGRKIGDQVREGVLPHLSLGHNMETGNVEELSVVQEGYRQGTQTMRLPRTLDQRPKTKQDKLMFYASKAEALAMLAQDASLLLPRMENKTETTPQPAETKATPPPPPPAETKPTEDTAMKTASETKSEPETSAEKRKKPEEESNNNSGEDMSEGVKKLTKLVEEHSDVKALLQELSEKNKTNEKIAEVYRKQAAKQFAEGQCLALGLSKGTPEFERRFGEQIQFAAQHPQVLEPLMDQIIARATEAMNPSTPALGPKAQQQQQPPAQPQQPPTAPEKKTIPAQEKKPKKESFDFIQSLTRKTQHNLLEQELKGGSSSSSSSSADAVPRSSSSTTENWTRVNTSQPTAPPSMNPFLKQMMEDVQVRRLMNQSQQLVTAKAGHENARHNEINSSIVERFQRWQMNSQSFDGVCPDRFSMAAPVWQEARPWPAHALRT